MITHRNRLIAGLAGVVLAAFGHPASAQVTATVGEEPPPEFQETLSDPAERPRTLGQRNFRDLSQVPDVDLTTEAQKLTVERDERVRRVAEWEDKIDSLNNRIQRSPSERDRKALLYDRARVNYMVQEVRHQIQLISERLDALAKERVRRSGEGPAPSNDPEDAANLLQMRRAVHLMGQYDNELRQILSRDPVTELDLIEALTLLKRREVLTEAFDDYFAAIAKREAESADAGDTGE